VRLPTYDRPPVVETVVGVQFDPIRGLSNGHLGAFWHQLGDEWPRVSHANPLNQEFEEFGDEGAWGGLGARLRLTTDSACRLQIHSAADDRMIQVQNGRLHLNWLAQGGRHAYPRYSRVREGFDELLHRFAAFLGEQGLERPGFNQWEVTYLNHIPRETVWSDPSDWSFLRLLSAAPPLPAGLRPESASGEWHFEIEPRRGRLHALLQHVRQRKPVEQELLVLNLTARGGIPGDRHAFASALAGLDLGHEVIVRSFQAMMSDSANESWGLHHGG
jgi:uncharacterized protein (TIGR04255 family)